MQVPFQAGLHIRLAYDIYVFELIIKKWSINI